MIAVVFLTFAENISAMRIEYISHNMNQMLNDRRILERRRFQRMLKIALDRFQNDIIDSRGQIAALLRQARNRARYSAMHLPRERKLKKYGMEKMSICADMEILSDKVKYIDMSAIYRLMYRAQQKEKFELLWLVDKESEEEDQQNAMMMPRQVQNPK